MVTSIVVAIFASTGFWEFLRASMENRRKKDSAESRMLKGLGHDRICYLGEKYVARGYITRDEFENLYDYLYIPYKELGGNGTAEKIVEEVKRLPPDKRCTYENKQ